MKIPKMKYPIGTKFTLKRPNYTRECEVIDYRFLFDSKGNLIQTRYVTQHTTLGQPVRDYDVVQTTIDRALAK